MNTIEKSFDELDVEQVNFKSGDWIWGNGGFPQKDDEYSISYIDESMIKTRYKLPECINYMLKTQHEWGDACRSRKIRDALGI